MQAESIEILVTDSISNSKVNIVNAVVPENYTFWSGH